MCVTVNMPIFDGLPVPVPLFASRGTCFEEGFGAIWYVSCLDLVDI